MPCEKNAKNLYSCNSEINIENFEIANLRVRETDHSSTQNIQFNKIFDKNDFVHPDNNKVFSEYESVFTTPIFC